MIPGYVMFRLAHQTFALSLSETREIVRLNGEMVEIEGTHIGHQQASRRVGAANVAVLLQDVYMRYGASVDNGEAIVDRVRREQAPVDQGERALGLQGESCLPPIGVDAGRKKSQVRFVLRLDEFVRGIAGGDIGLVSQVADRYHRLLQLYLAGAV